MSGLPRGSRRLPFGRRGRIKSVRGGWSATRINAVPPRFLLLLLPSTRLSHTVRAGQEASGSPRGVPDTGGGGCCRSPGSQGLAPHWHLTAPATGPVRDYFSYPAELRRRFLRRGAEPALPGPGVASQSAQLRVQPRRHQDGWAGCLLVLVLLLPTQLARSFGLSFGGTYKLPPAKKLRKVGRRVACTSPGLPARTVGQQVVKQVLPRNARSAAKHSPTQPPCPSVTRFTTSAGFAPVPMCPPAAGACPQLARGLKTCPKCHRLLPRTGGSSGHLLPRCVSRAEGTEPQVPG